MQYSNYLQAIIAAYVPSADLPLVAHRHLGIIKVIAQYCNAINHWMCQLGSGQHSNHIPELMTCPDTSWGLYAHWLKIVEMCIIGSIRYLPYLFNYTKCLFWCQICQILPLGVRYHRWSSKYVNIEKQKCVPGTSWWLNEMAVFHCLSFSGVMESAACARTQNLSIYNISHSEKIFYIFVNMANSIQNKY